jgi:dihydrofolate synthase / folylpolyglutamate synthase
MTYPEAIQFLYDLRLFGAKFGLENTFKLAARAGHPQNRLRFIHVAGTNGKGSTCAMLESIYRAAGLRVGLFTSPHLVSFRERIQVNRQLIPESDVVRLVEELRALQSSAGFQPAGSAGIPARSSQTSGTDAARTRTQDACATFQPTFFEVVTVMALKYFVEQQCDLVIWETGLGGRLDATNIVTPLAAVITNIAFDHQQWLGDTLEKIAAEKAGIIKPGVPVVTATDDPAARAVIERTAREKQSPLIEVISAEEKLAALFRGAATLSLLGDHQQLNVALALATVEVLQKQIPVSDAAIRAGLTTVRWPGRMQLVAGPSGQKLLLDGAHNVAGANALRRTLAKYFGGAKYTLILGVLRDKDWRRICETLAPPAGRILTVPVASERTADARELAAACRAMNPAAEVTTCASLGEALHCLSAPGPGRAELPIDRDARQSVPTVNPLIVVTGSLYLVGEALELLGLEPATGVERALNEWNARTQPQPAAG